MFETIVIGVDGSDASMRAVTAACGLAGEATQLWLVHAPLPDTVAFSTGAAAGYHMMTVLPNKIEVEEAAAKILNKATLAAENAGGQITGHEVRDGDPGDEILAFAKDKEADLIVTGRRGLGNIAGLLIGSTSQRIAHHATCAVLSVP